MSNENQVQINCEYLLQANVNGHHVIGCAHLKTMITNQLNNYCLGDKCPILLIKQEQLAK